jgi:hypothetical protein
MEQDFRQMSEDLINPTSPIQDQEKLRGSNRWHFTDQKIQKA